MKEWMEKLRGMGAGKAAALFMLVLCCGAWLIFPHGEGNSGAPMTQDEQRISATLSCIAGAGETRVSIYYAGKGAFGGSEAPAGAVIVSEGAGDVGVRLRLLTAAETLLGLPAQRVAVFEMEKGGKAE